VVEANLPEQKLPEQIEITAFRVIEEFLSNVSRHASASKVEIHLTADDRSLLFSITDNGCGMDLTAPQGPDTFGWIDIQERIRALYGTLHIESAPNAGMRIQATLPLLPENSTGRTTS
jgi:signal transduction histidine kinase